MLIGVVLGLAVAAGVPWPAAAATALAVFHPAWFLVGAAAWAAVHWKRRAGPTADDESAFLRGLAAELAAGASLRRGVTAAAARAPVLDLDDAVRLCEAGFSVDAIGRSVGAALPVNGVAAAATFRLAATTGGAIGPVVAALASRAEAMGRLARERSALTAQARLSAWIVGGAPIGLVLLGLVTGRGLDAGDLGRGGTMLMGTGLALIGAGALVVWAMVRRADR